MRKIALALAAVLVLGGLIGGSAGATHGEDIHSDNIDQIAQVPISMGKDAFADGSDMAFQGDLLVAGGYQGTSLFRILERKPFLKQIGFHNCPGAQGDISVWGDLAFVSLDGGSQGNLPGCNDTDDSAGKEGIRIIDISNPKQIRQVKFVTTECGSHTHTLVPGKGSVYLYIKSYPLAQSADCNVVGHRKISVVEVPLNDPTKAKVVSTPDVSPAIGCHDTTVFPEKKIAAVACITESQIWDISDPANPTIISRIYNPGIQIHHSTAITWDGKIMVIGDEFAGSTTGTCVGERPSPIGAMWFYDISDPTSPALLGYYNIPRRALPETTEEAGYMACTTHNYNVIPMKDPKRYVVAAGYRNAGLSIIDFSDPANAKEIAYYLDYEEGMIPDVWSGYWYNGLIYTNDNGSARGLSLYRLKGTGRADTHYFDGRFNPQTQIADFK